MIIFTFNIHKISCYIIITRYSDKNNLRHLDMNTEMGFRFKILNGIYYWDGLRIFEQY